MFENEYKNSLNDISPDQNLKQNILEKLESAQKPSTKGTIKFTRAATAIAAAFAIVLSIWSVNRNPIEPSVSTATQTEVISQTLNSAKSYSEIFKKIKSVANKDKFNILYEYAVDEEESYVDIADDVNAGTGATGGQLKGNSSAKPNATQKPQSATNSEAEITYKTDATNESEDFSTTNTQVENVDEADVVKTDGKYIYILSRTYTNKASTELKIVRAGKTPQLISSTCIDCDTFLPGDEMYICGNKLVILGTTKSNYTTKTYGKIDSISRECNVAVYDISAPEKVNRLYLFEQSGRYSSSRMINNTLYLISEYSVNTANINKQEPETYVPTITAENINGAVDDKCVVINDDINSAVYTVVSGYNIPKGELVSNISILGGTDHIYCSTKNIVTANYSNYKKADSTELHRFSIKDGKIEYKANGMIDGYLHNQFSMDEYNGYFRFVTTSTEYVETEHVRVSSTTYNHLFVLDKDLKQVGKIKDLAPDETIKSARFMGDTAFFVTFREVDPLFSVDLSNPENPKIIGELKIPGFSDYLYPFGNGTLLGVGREEDNHGMLNVKLSLFDISNPANVSEYAKYITELQHSAALYNHKATFVDAKRQLVGFSGNNYFKTDNSGDYSSEYFIYGIENGAFTIKYRFELDTMMYTENLRGLYIGDYFYIVTPEYVQVLDFNTFTDVYKLKLN